MAITREILNTNITASQINSLPHNKFMRLLIQYLMENPDRVPEFSSLLEGDNRKKFDTFVLINQQFYEILNVPEDMNQAAVLKLLNEGACYTLSVSPVGTVLHKAVKNLELLKEVLALVPEGERFAAVKEKDRQGYTVLHLVADNPSSLEAVLALYPNEGERLAALKEKTSLDYTVLHLAAGNSASLKVVLDVYPEGECLAAVKEEDYNHHTVLHLAARNSESLKAVLALYPESERFAAVKEGYGETLRMVENNPESLRVVFALLSKEELGYISEDSSFSKIKDQVDTELKTREDPSFRSRPF